MGREDKYFKTLGNSALWKRYCGYLDYTIDEFMEVQHRLLMQQIDIVSDSLLGRKILNDQKPRSVDEFRLTVPLTTYEDYDPYLSEKDETALAVKPLSWCHSSGRGGKYKWFPYTSEAAEVYSNIFISYLILAATTLYERSR